MQGFIRPLKEIDQITEPREQQTTKQTRKHRQQPYLAAAVRTASRKGRYGKIAKAWPQRAAEGKKIEISNSTGKNNVIVKHQDSATEGTMEKAGHHHNSRFRQDAFPFIRRRCIVTCAALSSFALCAPVHPLCSNTSS